jgi:hypothetical protein
MFDRYRAVLTVAAAAFLVLVLQGHVRQASAQTETGCGIAGKDPCRLTGYKLLANPNEPAVLILQLETPQGSHSFFASRLVIEHLAKDLLRDLENLSKKRL